MAVLKDSTQIVSPKVTLAVAASALVTVLAWLAGVLFGLDVPELIQGAFSTVLVFVAGYATTDPLRDEYEGKHELR